MANTNRKKVVLVVLDGWGIGKKNSTNPIYTADLKNIKEIKHWFPSASLQASGLLIGLPWSEEGNSEIGHLTIGAGRTVYQSAARISMAIKDGSFFENPVLIWAMEEAKKKGKSVNIAGLVGTGITHSALRHLLALVEMADKIGVRYKLHLMTDGRDSDPKACLDIIKELPEDRIGSIGGRFFGMDRDNHLERTEKAYLAMTGRSRAEKISPSQYVEGSYGRKITDEFINPVCFRPEELSVNEGDSLIFFNFRADRMRQISNMFAEKMPGVTTTSLTRYDESSSIPYAFSFEKMENALPSVISKVGLPQLHIAESEKQAHVTYFFNAEHEEPLPGEFRIIIPSKNVVSHDKYPQMMAEDITSRVVTAMEENLYGFILVNYANADIVAHTGNLDAVVEAVRFVDEKLGILTEAAAKTGYSLLITADHGNAEELIDMRTGEKDTRHNPNPVPFYLVDERFRRERSDKEIEESESLIAGTLCDIAPTILDLMDIPKPPEMTGQSLLPFLQ